MSTYNTIETSFNTALDCLQSFISDTANLEKVYFLAKKIAQAVINGNKVISCGNGGSMCDAMHFAEELTGRFRDNRRALPAMAIADPSHITCTANDYGFDYIFSRYVEGVGQEKDILLSMSTSGNSPNIIEAVKAAKEKGIYTICLLGKGGGKLKDMADHVMIVPGETSDRIQEIHIKILHIAIEAAEEILKNENQI